MKLLQNLKLKSIYTPANARLIHISNVNFKNTNKQALEDHDGIEDIEDDLIGGTSSNEQTDTPLNQSSNINNDISKGAANPSTNPWLTAVEYLKPKLADGVEIDPRQRPKARKVVDALVHAKNQGEIDVGIDFYRRWQNFKLGVNRNAHGQILENLCKQGRANVAFEFLSDFNKFNITLPDRKVARSLSLKLFELKDEIATPLQLLPILRAFHFRPHDAFCVANAIRSLEPSEMRTTLIDYLSNLNSRRVIPVEVNQVKEGEEVWNDLRRIAEEEGKSGDWLDVLGDKLLTQKSKLQKYEERKQRKALKAATQ